MKTSVIVPVMDQLDDTKGVWGAFAYNLSVDVELVIVNNGEPETPEFIHRFIDPKAVIVENGNQGGVIQSLNRGAAAASGDVLIFTHNDLLVYGENWDKSIVRAFEQMPALGLVGAFGAQGTYPDGGRLNSWGNMLEQEIHGSRCSDLQAVSHLDGIMLATTRKVFEDVGGFDAVTYDHHHFYDRDLSMSVLSKGFRVAVLPLAVHHLNGVTANRSGWQKQAARIARDDLMIPSGKSGDQYLHDKNMKAFGKKWADALPVYVENDFSFSSQPPFRGDAITRVRG